MKDSEVLILRCSPPFYPQLASRSLLNVALLGCLPSLDAAVCVMRLHGLFFGTSEGTAGDGSFFLYSATMNQDRKNSETHDYFGFPLFSVCAYFVAFINTPKPSAFT